MLELLVLERTDPDVDLRVVEMASLAKKNTIPNKYTDTVLRFVHLRGADLQSCLFNVTHIYISTSRSIILF